MSETEVSTTDPPKRTNDSSCPDTDARSRVLKEVGFTSTAFIGPAFPPPSSTAKCDIEDSLNEFYKELEKTDVPDGEAGSQAKIPPEVPTFKESQEKHVNSTDSTEMDGYLKNSRHSQKPRLHWYGNEPYQRSRERPEMRGVSSTDQNLWHYPHPPDAPRHLPMSHRPPFPDHTKQPEAFHRSNNPSYVSLTSDGPYMMSHHPNKLHFPPFSNVPPPNVCPHPSQGFHLDCYRSHPEVDENRQEWSTYDSENEEWERRHSSPPHSDAHRPLLVLILMRGLPGSGKSTMARELLSSGPSGIILSTDDYFAQKNNYRYDPQLLGAAHEWNHSRARDALCDGRSPVIIDNTNLEAWEMKPYVKMALDKGYKVDFCEPDTSWKFDPYELEKRNKHGVNREKIAQMMDRFCFPISIDIVMNSQEPPHVLQRRPPEQMRRRR
ncbi:NEDD4-binding protein 2-like 2 [Oryzias melastigma]|uniref:NEDD4-binding protein 2-like 2 n=1 Tax=Oryzias melastigma TaxID=30732 RepID=A0A834C8V2_ORYME|nr:NEDD4-binding protein 2-like 2 [Oryzias melastigma]